MASFTDYITVEGERMLAKAVAGTSVSFTKIVIGSGYMPSGAYEKNIKEVITPEVELPVQSVSVNSSDSVLITSRFTNKDIEHGFFLREKAVYMSDGNDEVLAIYGNNGSSAEFIDTAEVCVVDKTIKSVVKLSTQELANINIVDDNYEFAPVMEPDIKTINDFVKTTAALAMRVGQRVIINQWTAYTYIGYDPTDTSCYITGANVLSDVYDKKLADGSAERGVGASQNALFNVYGIASKTAEGLSAHLQDKSNPHGVTKSQVGLGNVPNVSTNDQTPTYSAAGTLATLTSGEKLSVSFGKIMKAITELIGLKEDVSDLNSNLDNNYQKKLTNPLTQSDVVNNLTSTSTIKPLSAAQGKVLYDNQKKIMATSGIKALNSTYGCYYYKNGNSVIITADFANKTIPQAGITLGTLPTSYKPSIVAYSRNGFDNQHGEMRVSSDGVVTLSSSSGSFNYGHFTCSYPAYSNFD